MEKEKEQDKQRTENIQVKIDKETRAKFREYCFKNGLSMSNELYLYILKIVESEK